jgi:hypothetical protein
MEREMVREIGMERVMEREIRMERVMERGREVEIEHTQSALRIETIRLK